MTGGWPKWHADVANSGRNSADTSKLVGTVAWSYSIGAAGTSPVTGGPDTYDSSPVVAADGTIYQVSMSGELYAFSPAGGLLWATQLTDPSSECYPSTPAIRADGSLVVLTGQDYQNSTGATLQLFVVSSAGVVLFSEAYGEDGFDGPPTIGADGTVFLTDDDGSGGADPYSALAWTVQNGDLALYAGQNFGTIGANAGEEQLSVALTESESSYWALNGQYFALTAPTQSFTVAAPWPAAGITVANGSTDPDLVLTSANSRVAIDTKTTGFVLAYTGWEDGDIFSLAGPYSVLGSLTALNASTGAVQWTVTLPTTVLPSTWVNALISDSGSAAPAIASDGTVYVGTGTGLLAVNGATGATNWTFSSANVGSSPAIGGDGTVFFGCDDGTFYAVTSAGALRFKYLTGGPISSGPAIGPDGDVYVVSDDGNLYAFH
jgi:outer membrane protein assembly factor BamB